MVAVVVGGGELVVDSGDGGLERRFEAGGIGCALGWR